MHQNSYGMSETTMNITVWPQEALPCGPPSEGTVGIMTAGFTARLVKPDWTHPEGVDVAEGESGELLLKSPSIVMGYIDNRRATKEAFTPDGWFKTGDEVRPHTCRAHMLLTRSIIAGAHRG